MWKYFLLQAIFFIGVNTICPAQENKIISEFKNSKALSNAIIGICIQDVNGKEIVSVNKNISVTPASVLKIVTTATALELLGPNYRFKTELLADNKDKLIIRGLGDPTLGSEHFNAKNNNFLNEWVGKIQNKFSSGVTEIEVDDSYFGYDGVSQKWIREDIGNYYAAGSYGISIFDNSYKLYFNTSNKKSPPDILKTEPEMPDIVFTNTLTLNSTGKDNGYIIGEPFSNKRILTGNIPSGRAAFSIKGDIPDPGLFLAKILAKLLSKNGNTPHFYTSRTANATVNIHEGEVFYTHLSPTLKEIIRVINVKSNNHYAEHLIRIIGKPENNGVAKSDPLENGLDIINKYWQGKGLDTGSLFMYDGCGLSPSNAISPQLMCNILGYMYCKSKNSEAFFASFPKAGEEGTVRNFLKGSNLQGKVFVKSGSIANVQCYSGYYIDGEKKYVFSVMVNNFRKDTRREVVKAIETLLLGIL